MDTKMDGTQTQTTEGQTPPAPQGQGSGTPAPEGGQPPARSYTQDEYDRAMAAARRDGATQARKGMGKDVEAAVSKALEPFKHLLNKPPAEGSQGGATSTPADPEPPKGGDKKPPEGKPGEGKDGKVEDHPELAKLRAQLAEQQAQVRALTKENETRGQREKEARNESHRKKAIDDATTYFQGQGLTPTAARTLAKAKLADGDIVIGENGAAQFKTGDLDEETNEPEVMSLKLGIEKWGRSAEANEHRPAMPRGAGSAPDGKKTPPVEPPKPGTKDARTPGQRWQEATTHDSKLRATSRG